VKHAADLRADSNHGGRRDGAGRPPHTIKGLLRKMSPAETAKFRHELRRYALRLLIDGARAELRGVK